MQGKTIVATGATSGIGEAAVLALAGLGARIVVARDEARAQATMQKLKAKAPGLDHRLHLGWLEHQPRYAAFLTPSPSFPHSSRVSASNKRSARQSSANISASILAAGPLKVDWN